MKKKKQCRKAGWATAHFPALCHDTMYCIVTGKGTSAQGCAARPCDTAETGHDTVGPRRGRAARELKAWPLGGVSRYNWAYRDRRPVR